jgi:hypothetical protein
MMRRFILKDPDNATDYLRQFVLSYALFVALFLLILA